MQLQDAYELLHIDASATAEDVKKAYRKLCHLYHPDNSTGDEQKFRLLKLAKAEVEKAINLSKLYITNEKTVYVVSLEDYISYKSSSVMKLISGEMVDIKTIFRGCVYLYFNVNVEYSNIGDEAQKVEEYTTGLSCKYVLESRYNLAVQVDVTPEQLFTKKDVTVSVLGIKSSMAITTIGTYFIKVADIIVNVTVSFKPITEGA